jgi:hypothetical protein
MLRPAGLRTFDTLQTCGAAVVFTALLAANPVAYALYHNPNNEWLWRLSIPLNRAAEPLSQLIHSLTTHPVAVSLVILVLVLGFSISSYLKRNWLGIAVSGHVALAGLAMSAWNLVDQSVQRTVTASSIWYVDPLQLNARVWVTGTVLAVMFVLCILNHIVFFRHRTLAVTNDRPRKQQ